MGNYNTKGNRLVYVFSYLIQQIEIILRQFMTENYFMCL